MNAFKYAVNQHLIQIFLSLVRSGDIAIPEIQRPFVWDSSKVREEINIDALLEIQKKISELKKKTTPPTLRDF